MLLPIFETVGGPFKNFLAMLHQIQLDYPADTSPIRTALITARGAIMGYLDRVPREEVERRALVETLKYVALGWVTTHLHSRLSRFLKWVGRNGNREWLFSVA